MKKARLLTITLILATQMLFACNEKGNPLLGRWQQISPVTGETGQVIEFTPSTMRINDTRVTVVYQIRKNKIRVSASKNEIIYEFIDKDTIAYEDKQIGSMKLFRVKP